MSKRTRGTRRTQARSGQRPGQPRRNVAAPVGRAAAAPSQLAAATEMADELIEDRPAAAVENLARIARSTPARARTKPTSLLAAKAATEYVYVVQDVMRIAVVAVLLFGTMLLLWLLIVVLRVVPL